MYKIKWNQFIITLSFLIALHIRHAFKYTRKRTIAAFMSHSAKKMGKWVKPVSANMAWRRDSTLRWQHRAGHSRASLTFARSDYDTPGYDAVQFGIDSSVSAQPAVSGFQRTKWTLTAMNYASFQFLKYGIIMKGISSSSYNIFKVQQKSVRIRVGEKLTNWSRR